MLILVGLAGAIAAPAAVLRFLCIGPACDEPAARAEIPFCSLPPELRSRIAAGFRDGRSPDILAVTVPDIPISGTDTDERVAPTWPTTGPADSSRVPLVFAGAGTRADVPGGTTLNRVAPTIAAAMGIDRPFPEVRSGTAIEHVSFDARTPLAVVMIWKGVGSADLERAPQAWPTLRALLAGGGTLDADVGSLPLDPTAAIATIGTGGTPAEHGITGSIVRNDSGRAVEAWGSDAPFSVIATLGDDLDEVQEQQARVGVVGTSPLDRGAIGRDWYVEHDDDDAVIVGSARRAATAAVELLATGYGSDGTPDLLAVVIDGPLRALDRATRRVADAVIGPEAEAPGLLVVTSTGSMEPSAIPVQELVDDAVGSAAIPDAIEATTTGGWFLDQQGLVEANASEDRVIRSLRRIRVDGSAVFADVFSGTAVELAGFCP